MNEHWAIYAYAFSTVLYVWAASREDASRFLREKGFNPHNATKVWRTAIDPLHVEKRLGEPTCLVNPTGRSD